MTRAPRPFLRHCHRASALSGPDPTTIGQVAPPHSLGLVFDCAPIALSHIGLCDVRLNQTMSGFDTGILRELPNVVGLVLWQNLRHTHDWVQTTGDKRNSLFHRTDAQAAWVREKRAEARRTTPELAAALTTFETWLRSPEAVPNAALADACEMIARWAYTQGFVDTGAHYAEAAAQIEPPNLGRTIAAAKMARDSGDMKRAERWFGLVIVTARSGKQWEEYIRANLGLGILFMLTKQDQRARKHLEHAAKKARREGYEWLAAEAQHDLFQFMTIRGNYEAAEVHARKALEWYPKNNPRLPFLVADAAFLLILRRHYSEAVELLRHFLRAKDKPPQNLLGLSMFVRALGAMGQRRKFERMRRKLLREIPQTTVEAAARWHLAEGERAMGRWQQASEEAAESLSLSLARQDAETAEFARWTLGEVEARRPVPVEVARAAPEVTEFVRLVTSRLAEWAPTKRGRPRRRPPEDWDH